MLDDLLILVGYVLFMSVAFQGLLGAYYRWMRAVAGPFTADLKVYAGKNAVFWGLVFFFAFSLVGIFSAISFIENSGYGMLASYAMIASVTVLSFYIALFSRRIWPFKPPKSRSQPKTRKSLRH